MKIVIKEKRCNNVKYRIIIKEIYADKEPYGIFDYDLIYEYHVQIRRLGIWFTIKKFIYNASELIEELPLAKIEAQELLDAIVNPYKIS